MIHKVNQLKQLLCYKKDTTNKPKFKSQEKVWTLIEIKTIIKSH